MVIDRGVEILERVETIPYEYESEQKRLAKLKPYGETRKGGRLENQDSLLVNTDREVFAVMDGVGGESGGAKASEFVARRLHAMAEEGKVLAARDIEKIDREMRDRGLRGYTTLVTARKIRPNEYRVFSVGDSSAWLVSTEGNGKIERLTPVDQDERGKLSNYMNRPGGARVHERVVRLGPGQVLLLATDGVDKRLNVRGRVTMKNTNQLEIAGMARSMIFDSEGKGNQRFVKALLDLLEKDLRTSDNVAVVSMPYVSEGRPRRRQIEDKRSGGDKGGERKDGSRVMLYEGQRVSLPPGSYVVGRRMRTPGKSEAARRVDLAGPSGETLIKLSGEAVRFKVNSDGTVRWSVEPGSSRPFLFGRVLEPGGKTLAAARLRRKGGVGWVDVTGGVRLEIEVVPGENVLVVERQGKSVVMGLNRLKARSAG